MKKRILILPLLFMLINALMLSGVNSAASKTNETLTDECASLKTGNALNNDIACTQTPAGKIKSDATRIEQATDYELPLSPISRFILLQ